MKFKMTVANKESPNKTWTEDYDRDTNDVEGEAKAIINYWNSTLRPHDKERVLVGVEIIKKESK